VISPILGPRCAQHKNGYQVSKLTGISSGSGSTPKQQPLLNSLDSADVDWSLLVMCEDHFPQHDHCFNLVF